MPFHIEHQLSQQHIDAFFNDGYFIIKKYFHDDEIDRIKLLINRLQDQAAALFKVHDNFSEPIKDLGAVFVLDVNGDRRQIKRVVWAGAAQPELIKFARQPKILNPVAQLLDSHQADHLINQIHFKLPGDAVAFPWHQDCQHRRKLDQNWCDVNGKGSFVQTLIAIDAANCDNGAVHVIPSSMGRGDLYLDQITDSDELERFVGPSEDHVPLILNPGDIVFMHPHLIHGSGPNESTKSRRVLINGFSYPGANTAPYPGDGSAGRIDL